MSESNGAGFGRKVLAVLCCAVWVVGYIAVCVVLIYHYAGGLHDWADRQRGILNVICTTGVGLGYLFLFAFGFGITGAIWESIVGPTAGVENETHPDDSEAADEPASRCPKCGFKDLWDGKKCGHCRYAGNPWDHGARSAD